MIMSLMKKKLLGIMVGSLVITGCSGLFSSNKVLTCTATDTSGNRTQELKYVVTFNKEGTKLEKVAAKMTLVDAGDFSLDNIDFCDSIVQYNCDVKKLKNGNVVMELSRKIKEDDEIVLGDFYIDDNSTYKQSKENFVENEWNSLEWSCK